MRRLCHFLLCLGLLASPAFLLAAETLQLARSEKLATQYIAAQLLQEIYRRSGLAAEIEALPPARANLMVTRGQKDGEVARIESYAVKNPGLIKVTPAYYYITTTVYAKNRLSIKSKDELKGLRVGAIRGVTHAEDLIAGLEKAHLTNDGQSLYLMLDADRLDVAIDTGTNGNHMIKKLKLPQLRPVAELARLDLFHFLAADKAEFAPVISKTISAMKKSGELERLTQQFEQAFIASNIEP